MKAKCPDSQNTKRLEGFSIFVRFLLHWHCVCFWPQHCSLSFFWNSSIESKERLFDTSLCLHFIQSGVNFSRLLTAKQHQGTRFRQACSRWALLSEVGGVQFGETILNICMIILLHWHMADFDLSVNQISWKLTKHKCEFQVYINRLEQTNCTSFCQKTAVQATNHNHGKRIVK